MGMGFTLSHFIAFLYKFSIIHYNYQSENPEQFNPTKKVLTFLRDLEISDAFKNFLVKLNRTYSQGISFLPSKKLLIELLINEGFEEHSSFFN